jgi:16S rRNA (cytidine1402-2'-O)-methyltransferase
MRTIIDLARLLGDRQIMLAREMTKLHQQFIFGSASDLADRTVPTVGEYTIVIGPSEKNHKMTKLPVSEAEVRRDFYQMTEHGRLDRRETVRAVAKKHGLQVNQVYRLVQGRNDSTK